MDIHEHEAPELAGESWLLTRGVIRDRAMTSHGTRVELPTWWGEKDASCGPSPLSSDGYE